MTTDDKIRGEKLEYDVNREAANISIIIRKKMINMNLLQVRKYYLLIKDRTSKVFIFSLRKKLFWKIKKIIEDQGKKQIIAIEDHGKQ